ncbi:H-NS histone family protein [Bradyrhizobium sp. SZCCHNRI2049]|uniref:H-NS histone family protein n=1 Tax=Bradyrhizobium sp. SZCCHNRI2049 TaxID=3057287 RepID=UPI002915F813|nr:H-NS histone family protein [Bradyrhizobium sp. SZCCHNRI2049]
MKSIDIESMSMDDLLAIRKKINQILGKRVLQERRELQERLKRLDLVEAQESLSIATSRRKYPPVMPKYRNPAEPSQTWSGRGSQPRWMRNALKLGKKISDFEIRGTGDASTARRTKSIGRSRPLKLRRSN